MNIAFSRTLKLSSPLLRGNDVLALQTQLGIPLGQRDGVFGKATQQAVIAYQNRQQLTADGVVGRRTWASLFGTDSVTETPNADNTHVDSNAQLVIAESLKQLHSVYPDACKWQLTASGIEIEGKGIETSKGEPKTVSRVCQDYKDALEQAAKKTGVPVELLIATMCTEAFDATMHTVNPKAYCAFCPQSSVATPRRGDETGGGRCSPRQSKCSPAGRWRGGPGDLRR